MPLETSYTAQAAGSATASRGESTDRQAYWSLTKLRKCYTDYLFSKREEIDEQIEARRYYHGSQYTQEQIAALRKRRQPIMTFNRVSRKIDGVVGLIERLRQDPKAFPRTPKHEEGAELATATLRYVLDAQDWKAKSPICSMTAAVDGIGGIEMDLIEGDQGDPEIGISEVEIDSFFYDPRSHRADFDDARYMGVGKWLDDDIAKDMFPNADENAFSSDDELTSNSDREARWFRSDGIQRRVRVVEIWYKHQGGWCWAVFSGNAVLKEGKSPFRDEKGKTYCKYIMFSGNVDQDGDRYGFVRNMKSPQDGINAKQSKMQHILASKRIILSQGAVDDIEKTRAEWARPDGVVLTNRPVNEGVKTDDQAFDFAGWVKMLELNLTEIENFGPNPALIGQGIESKSGRAIALLQQAGMAELGPFILGHRGWKIRAYRAFWNAIQQHWQAERWIRVTDDDGLAQFIQINGLQIDPMTGQPNLVNAIGSLDVDVILDEGPDSVNMMQDLYETLSQVVPAVAPMLNPAQATAMIGMLIDVSPMAAAQKKKFREAGEQQDPMAEQKAQLQLEGAVAEVRDTQAAAGLKEAQAVKALTDARVAPMEAMMNGQGAPMQPMEYEPPPEIQDAREVAEIEEKHASATLKYAQADKAQVETRLAPAQLAADQANAAQDRQLAQRNADADRKVAMKKATQKPNTPARR